MAFEQELQRKILDFRELGLPVYIHREGSVHVADRMVSTIIGARRAGKSFRAFQVADEMIRKDALDSLECVCHVDFDNPLLSRMKSTELQMIPDTFLKLNPRFTLKTPLLFALDEIHKVEGWEQFAVELSRNPAWHVVVTGSSSKMLRSDLSTELRGKAVSTVVYPLSYKEYLSFRGFQDSPGSTKGRAEAARLFDDYLAWGAYPALPAMPVQTKEAVLREYFDTMILKDIIQRHNVSKPRQCIHLYRYLLSNISKPHTLQSVFRYMKQAGYVTSRDSLRDYLGWAEDAWLLFQTPLFSDSIKEQERNYKKIYAIDWALANRNSHAWDGSLSRAMENMVFLHLYRNFHRVHFYLTRAKRQEVDFLAVDGGGNPVLALQVCMDITDPETRNRELNPLAATARYFKIEESILVTYNQEAEYEVEGVQIKALPAWKWMLGM